MKNYTAFDVSQIADAIKGFAESDLKGNSPLYYRLAYDIAADPDLCAIAAHVRYGQPIPNSFLAAIHYLLLSAPDEPLAKHYPSISGNKSDEIPYADFKRFCVQHKNDIINIISERIVQTNVIGRCSHLAVVFSRLIAVHPNIPVTMIDIGTSAGLTLNWNKYEYHYSDGTVVGASPVRIYAEVRDSVLPSFQLPQHPVRKIGIDQNLIDPTNESDARWLRALIWPDQLERFAAMDAALQVGDLKAIEFIKADGVDDFRKVITSVPHTELLIVYCTHAMYQFPMEMRGAFWKMLDGIGADRDFYFISVEGIQSQMDKYQTSHTVVELTTYTSGRKQQQLMAETNGHGNWVKWQ